MNPTIEHFREMVVKLLSGNCSLEEQLEVMRWVQQSDFLLEQFRLLEKTWYLSFKDLPSYKFDTQSALSKLHERITKFENTPVVKPRIMKSFNRKIIYIASSIAAILLIGIILLFPPSHKTEMTPLVITAMGSTNQDFTFPEGSFAKLRNGAEITYDQNFDQDSREIEFSGEAFFDIAFLPDKPFKIKVGNLLIEVLGTSFNLRANPNDDIVIVDLVSGKLKLSSFEEYSNTLFERIILDHGQRGIFSSKTGKISRESTLNDNFLAWETGILEFESTPLKVVIQDIAQAYSLTIKMNPKHSDLILTARFVNENPTDIFSALQMVFDLDIEINDDVIKIN